MAHKRIGMKKIRDVIRLKSTTGMSDRQVARALNVSRPVVGQYWREFVATGLEYEQIAGMSDSELLELFERPRTRKSGQYRELAGQFGHYAMELKRKGVTLHLLWREYRQEHPQGYSYSQFCYHFQVWRNASEVTMHVEHKAGDKMFVDYAGAKMAITDRKTGEKREMETFVAVFGASGLTYVEASESQQKEQWIRSNERAMWYAGGVPAAIVPDNLRSAVARSDPYEPGINPLYDDFAAYYGTVILPARVRKARDKALVENAVRLVYQRVYAPLRNREFYSLEELNEAMWEQLEVHNNTEQQRLGVSRREIFEDVERQALKPLAGQKYPLKSIHEATVAINYHVELREDRHYYSVPHYLRKAGRKTVVKMIYDERVVGIYYDNVRIVEHQRDRRRGGYTTVPEHMPSQHRFYAEWSPERLLRWGTEIGAEVGELIRRVLHNRKHPEQAFRACLGILSLGKKYGEARLREACEQANAHGICSYKRIEAMVKLIVQREQHPQLEWAGVGVHENLRGSAYYN